VGFGDATVGIGGISAGDIDATNMSATLVDPSVEVSTEPDRSAVGIDNFVIGELSTSPDISGGITNDGGKINISAGSLATFSGVEANPQLADVANILVMGAELVSSLANGELSEFISPDLGGGSVGGMPLQAPEQAGPVAGAGPNEGLAALLGGVDMVVNTVRDNGGAALLDPVADGATTLADAIRGGAGDLSTFPVLGETVAGFLPAEGNGTGTGTGTDTGMGTGTGSGTGTGTGSGTDNEGGDSGATPNGIEGVGSVDVDPTAMSLALNNDSDMGPATLLGASATEMTLVLADMAFSGGTAGNSPAGGEDMLGLTGSMTRIGSQAGSPDDFNQLPV
jgi:hypothetical protein